MSKRITGKNTVNNFVFRNKENKEVWSTFKVLASQPKECLGAYVISMTSSASDILSVMFLQKEANIKSKLRVVPLFETLEDKSVTVRDRDSMKQERVSIEKLSDYYKSYFN